MEASVLHAPSLAARAPGRTRLLRLRSDEQLLSLFRQGSDEAFAAIVDRYEARLLAYTRRMLGGSQQDAEDALQDVFLRAYGALRADERPVGLRAWLYRVAHNRCIDQIRRTPPAPPDVLAAMRGCDASDPQSACERRESLRAFVTDVERLPDAQRSALLMRELEGLSYAELCATLDVSLPAVKSLLVRARTSLAETGEARATPCAEIRADLVVAHDGGTRPDGRARRHMRECDPCRSYRDALQLGQSRAAAHHGPLATLAKLLGLGTAPAAGGSAVVAGGSAVSAKLAALVCCGIVAAGAGAAAELPHAVPMSRAVHPKAVHAPGAGALARALHVTVPATAAAAGSRPTRPAAVSPQHLTASTTPPAPVNAVVVETPSSSTTTGGAVEDDPAASGGTEAPIDDPTPEGTDPTESAPGSSPTPPAGSVVRPPATGPKPPVKLTLGDSGTDTAGASVASTPATPVQP